LYPGTRTVEALQFLETEPDTEGIVLIGEIGGEMEDEVADYLMQNSSDARGVRKKPMVGLVVGEAAPKGRILGHAGAIWELERERAKEKKRRWKDAGIHVVETPGEIGPAMKVRDPSLHVRNARLDSLGNRNYWRRQYCMSQPYRDMS
jgi:succinyl-CoA synthetase alpha subunit